MTTKLKYNRRSQQFSGLKVFLTVGAFAATLIGTRLLAHQDTAVLPQTPAVVQETAAHTIIAMPNSSKAITLELAPIPQSITPDIWPVARSTSSG